MRNVLDDNRLGLVAALLWDLKNTMNGGESMVHPAPELFSILETVGFSPVQFADGCQRSSRDYRIVAARKQ